jgi:hypothetical protein
MLRTIVAAILIVILTSCTTWKPVAVSPENYIRAHDPDAVWLQLEDGSTLMLARPRVIGDSLRGISAGAYRNVALTKVTQMRAQEHSGKKTAIAAAASAGFAVGIIYWLANSDRVQP